MRAVRSSRDRRGDSSTRTRDSAESGTPHNDGFAAFMRAQQGRINAAADAADARRQLSAEWLKLTVSERREWRRRDADYHQDRSDVGRRSLGSNTPSRTAGSTTPPRATRRKSPSTRSKHVRVLIVSCNHACRVLICPTPRAILVVLRTVAVLGRACLTPLPRPLLHCSPADP